MSDIPSPFVDDGAESFAASLEASLESRKPLTGQIVKGVVLAVENDAAVIDVGLKSEGRVPLSEFSVHGQPPEISIGDTVEVFVERMENRQGELGLSHERALREEFWGTLEAKIESREHVGGVITGPVRGGYMVDLGGITAFLPSSQVDIRPIRDIKPLLGSTQPFRLIKMDKAKGNIVVSRRMVLEETRAEQLKELISELREGQIVEGVVKNLTNYGAFVDLGGMDGLLHVTDIDWQRIHHPSEVLEIGQTIRVQILQFNAETNRISLGMKQLKSDPWDSIAERFPEGHKCMGKVTNITDYGAFIELEPGIEGLVHVSEMSWVRRNVHPGKILSTSQEVEVKILEINQERRRISLGLKQCHENPWEKIAENFPKGHDVEGEVCNVTDFGLFIRLTEDVDGMIHMNDITWDQTGEEALKLYKVGDMIKARVLAIDVERQRISLGIKQLSANPRQQALDGLKDGDVVTCEVVAVGSKGLEVLVNGTVEGQISRTNISRERSEQRLERYAPGEKVDAMILQLDSNPIKLSIKAYEASLAKEAMEAYGSVESGASLGDILGEALQQKQEHAEAEAAKATKAETKTTKAAEDDKAEAKTTKATKATVDQEEAS